MSPHRQLSYNAADFIRQNTIKGTTKNKYLVFQLNEKRDNKQCLFDTPRRVTVNNKRLLSKCKKSEKKCAYLQKAMALL